MKLKPLVEISWTDACSDSHVLVMEQDKCIDKNLGLPSSTVGYLLHRGPSGVVVAQADAHHKEGWEYRHTFEIPQGMVHKIRYLK